jgi:hypothetical protein
VKRLAFATTLATLSASWLSGAHKTMIDTGFDWKAEGRKLIHAVDPSMATTPIYLLGAHETEPIYKLNPNSERAITGAALSIELRELLVTTGVWQGPGFAAVFILDSFFDQRELLGVVLHEFCHDAETRRGVERLVSGLPDNVIRSFAFKPGTTTEPTRDVRPWHGHGPAFARLAVHVHYRAIAAGWDLMAYSIFHSSRYFLAKMRLYAEALGDEPERLKLLTMADVSATTPPASFTEFAKADLEAAERRWEKRKQEEATTALANQQANGAADSRTSL